MIAAVAHEAAAGRLLLVATTDVGTGQPVVWDLGAIAINGAAEARTLFRDVLVASASVPGMFPPVILRIQHSGAADTEAHVDGGVTVPFLIPTGFEKPGTAVYVIIEGRLGDAPRSTPLRLSTIVSRSVSAGLTRMMRTTLALTAAMSQAQGARLRYSAIPVRYPSWEAFDFRADAMRALFHFADQCAASGRLWVSPGVAPGNTPIEARSETKDSASCPTSDAFVAQVAAQQ
jgi:predicted acylesterase/phospholipase RssA